MPVPRQTGTEFLRAACDGVRMKAAYLKVREGHVSGARHQGSGTRGQRPPHQTSHSGGVTIEEPTRGAMRLLAREQGAYLITTTSVLRAIQTDSCGQGVRERELECIRGTAGSTHSLARAAPAACAPRRRGRCRTLSVTCRQLSFLCGCLGLCHLYHRPRAGVGDPDR